MARTINCYRVEGDVAVITLTQGQETRIDLDDLVRVLSLRWFAYWNPVLNRYYAVAHDNNDGIRRTVYLHRLVTNAPRGTHVTHKQGDSLDNRKAELEILSPKRSMQKQRRRYLGER